MKSRAFILLLLAGFACSAPAQTRVQVAGQPIDNGLGSFGETKPLVAGQDTVSSNLSRPGVFPSASLTLSTGQLRAAAILTTGSFFGTAAATIEDTLFIEGYLPAQMSGMLSMVITGTIDEGGGPIASSYPGSDVNSGYAAASLQTRTFGLGDTASVARFFSNTCGGIVIQCQVGGSFFDVVSVPFFFDDAHRAILLTASLFAQAFNGADVDFGSTGTLVLSLPSGLTFSSASGLLLTSPVPESSTLLMLLVGLGGVAAIARRRRV